MNETLLIVIIVAVIAFLFVLVCIYFKDIKSAIKNKFKGKKEVNPKEQKSVPAKNVTYTVEDFKPIKPEYNLESRDSSLDGLFKDINDIDASDDDFSNMANEIKQTDEGQQIDDSDYEKLFDMFGKNNDFDDGKNKTLAQKIQELPPELKVLVIDNLLGRKDDNKD